MTNYKPTLQECAMRYGTGMGLLWAFKFMLFPLGLSPGLNHKWYVLLKMTPAPIAFNSSGDMVLTVASVPTGINIGVGNVP